MSYTHTHRGHCQVCASVQAIDPKTGAVAKHGYNVKFGFFNGTCAGSGSLSMHVERKLSDSQIASARHRAAMKRDLAQSHAAGKTHPEHVWNGKYVKVPAPTKGWPDRKVDEPVVDAWDNVTPEFQQKGLAREIFILNARAEQEEDYARFIQHWVDGVFGLVDAYSVDALEPTMKVGDTVRVGGAKTGYDAVIEAVEVRPYRSNGYRRGTTSVMAPFALVTRPAITEKRTKPSKGLPEGVVTREGRPAKQVWEAMRHLKLPPSQLIEKLQKAGLL
jgi:hypothetical protein